MDVNRLRTHARTLGMFIGFLFFSTEHVPESIWRRITKHRSPARKSRSPGSRLFQYGIGVFKETRDAYCAALLCNIRMHMPWMLLVFTYRIRAFACGDKRGRRFYPLSDISTRAAPCIMRLLARGIRMSTEKSIGNLWKRPWTCYRILFRRRRTRRAYR